MSNYATKSYLKNATGVDTSQFAQKVDLANLKSKVDFRYLDEIRLDRVIRLCITKPCAHLQPAPSTSTQLISASP